jgi:hypothetical protein
MFDQKYCVFALCLSLILGGCSSKPMPQPDLQLVRFGESSANISPAGRRSSSDIEFTVEDTMPQPSFQLPNLQPSTRFTIDSAGFVSRLVYERFGNLIRRKNQWGSSETFDIRGNLLSHERADSPRVTLNEPIEFEGDSLLVHGRQVFVNARRHLFQDWFRSASWVSDRQVVSVPLRSVVICAVTAYPVSEVRHFFTPRSDGRFQVCHRALEAEYQVVSQWGPYRHIRWLHPELGIVGERRITRHPNFDFFYILVGVETK